MPGLLFLTPFFWAPEDELCKAAAERDAPPPRRACPEGYKERLKRWVEQQPGGPGKLDRRLQGPQDAVVRWVYCKAWRRAPAARAEEGAAGGGDPPRGLWKRVQGVCEWWEHDDGACTWDAPPEAARAALPNAPQSPWKRVQDVCVWWESEDGTASWEPPAAEA